MRENIIIIIGITAITIGIIMFMHGNTLAAQNTWTPGEHGIYNAFFGLAPVILGAGLTFMGSIEKAHKQRTS